MSMFDRYSVINWYLVFHIRSNIRHSWSEMIFLPAFMNSNVSPESILALFLRLAAVATYSLLSFEIFWNWAVSNLPVRSAMSALLSIFIWALTWKWNFWLKIDYLAVVSRVIKLLMKSEWAVIRNVYYRIICTCNSVIFLWAWWLFLFTACFGQPITLAGKMVFTNVWGLPAVLNVSTLLSSEWCWILLST